ncbi:unnamed protein product [Acanthoscelides obtectus]|nr:unnamed protein product [Acanthoscelides obtectus]CAK1680430.1 hypothetical protein AOBTE_LOCUS32649 [Acanthoscelides obtectus]
MLKKQILNNIQIIHMMAVNMIEGDLKIVMLKKQILNNIQIIHMMAVNMIEGDLKIIIWIL